MRPFPAATAGAGSFPRRCCCSGWLCSASAPRARRQPYMSHPRPVRSCSPSTSRAPCAPPTSARTAHPPPATRGVRVFTIGFGTTNPAPLVCSNSQFGGFGGGGYGGGFGGHNPLVADHDALRQIASITGGKFYRAENADQLKAALGNLSG